MKTFNIGELSARSGIATPAIRFYEKAGLMPEPDRTQSNYRRYTGAAVARLQFIANAKQWGFSLDEIRDLLILQDANGDRAVVKRIAAEKLARIQDQIRKLSSIETVLIHTLEECSGEGEISGCPIVEAIAGEEFTGESETGGSCHGEG